MKQRHTLQRELVLQAVRSRSGHFTAEELYQAILPLHPHISRATVYRNLRGLAEEGLIGRVLLPDAPDRYEHVAAKHYHFQCTRCGRVADVSLPYKEDLLSEIRDAGEYLIQSHTIVFYGLCPACRKAPDNENRIGTEEGI